MPLPHCDAAHDRSVEFAAGFSEEQARHEASRCLRCDLAYLCPTVMTEVAEAVAHAGRPQMTRSADQLLEQTVIMTGKLEVARCHHKISPTRSSQASMPAASSSWRAHWLRYCLSSGSSLLGLHLGRPYILDMIDRFTLRLGADLLWLVYVALRDLAHRLGRRDELHVLLPRCRRQPTQLPLTGGLAAACALRRAAHQADGRP